MFIHKLNIYFYCITNILTLFDYFKSYKIIFAKQTNFY